MLTVNIYIDTKGKHIIIKRMEKYLNKNNYYINQNYNDCDIQLCFADIKKKTKLKKILRLDGIYYDLNGRYKNRNNSISKSHQKVNAIIYQSEFSKRMCEEYLKQRNTNITSVIYNGIQQNWSAEYIPHDEFNIISASKWRRPKRLKEIIDIFLEFLNIFPNSYLHILGHLHENKKINNNRIIYYGMVNYKKMSKIYSIGDVFIHLCRRDSSPNSVVEAIGGGLPIITSNGCGGATEMASFTNGCIICNGDSEDILPDYPYKDSFNKLSKELKQNILDSLIKIEKDRRRVEVPKILNINYVSKKYIEIFEKVKNG